MLSCVAPSLHIFILIGPLSWYRYFSVGKKIAPMAVNWR